MAETLTPKEVAVVSEGVSQPLKQYYASVFGVGRTPYEFVISFGAPLTGAPGKLGDPVSISIEWSHSVIMSHQAAVQFRDALDAHIKQMGQEQPEA